MEGLREIEGRLRAAVRRDRLLDTAQKLVGVPSPTGEAGEVADALEHILSRDGFSVERLEAGHPRAPAVAVRLRSGVSGRTLQFDGHLDTVHLPFVPPHVDGDRLTGSGSSDMKSGLAAAVEALRALRDSGALERGEVLLTAHDLHEAPWGLGQQLDSMIREGWVGDAVLIPEPLSDRLPVAGRGAATWRATVRREGPPVHEVMRPAGQPSVIAAGAEAALRLARLGQTLAARRDLVAGSESVFVGQIHAGEIYNQDPAVCMLEGTRRWLPGADRAAVERELRDLFAAVSKETGTGIEVELRVIRDAFSLDARSPVVGAFQLAHQAVSGRTLPTGPKPFVDDGNSFCALARVPAITHGPLAGGQHTLEEWVSVDDLVRLARLYALTAVVYCGELEREGARA